MAGRIPTVTIADVASRAGVSLATVSRVMNGNPSVDAALAVKVHDAARALNYSASPLARSLVLGKTQTIGVVVPDLGNPTFQGALRGLSGGASKDGYHVLIADSAEVVAEERLLAIEARRRCDGIVLCAPRMPQEDLEHLLPQLAPVVLINRNPGSGRTPFVTADYHRGLDDILGHVLALGHTRIVYLAGSSRSASNSKRLAAFEAFRERHPDYRLDVLSGGVTFENGYDAAGSVVESGATAVLAYNDLVAMGLLSGLAERGVRVPDEISVAGFDDILFARYTTPSLTTAAVPVEQLGRLAWERLAALLKGEEPPGDVTIEPQLAVRHSTARPGAAS